MIWLGLWMIGAEIDVSAEAIEAQELRVFQRHMDKKRDKEIKDLKEELRFLKTMVKACNLNHVEKGK